MSLVQTMSIALGAAAIEATVGYPDALYRVLGHPVTWMGRWLDWLERRFNAPDLAFRQRRELGVVTLVLYLAPVVLAGGILGTIGASGAPGLLLVAIGAASLPAQRSLYTHVAAVAEALEAALPAGGEKGLAAARAAVAQIVGRDVNALDEAGVARAAIESLAENFSDGVVAPILWTAIGGASGGLLYKAINTADSMIGHRNERFEAFGFAAAKLDDWVNWPASRLSAWWLALAAGRAWREVRRATLRDAGKHRSPNAGWPEAAMAGALGLKLAGPRVYGAQRVDDAFMGDGRTEATAADVRRALALYTRACALQLVALALIAVLLIAAR